MPRLYIVGLPPQRVCRDFQVIQEVTGGNGDGHTPFLHISMVYPFTSRDVGRVEAGIEEIVAKTRPLRTVLGECQILHGAKYAVCLKAEPKEALQRLAGRLARVSGISDPSPEHNPHASVVLEDSLREAREKMSIVNREIKREKPKTTFQLGAITLLLWNGRSSSWEILREFPLRGNKG